MKAKPRPSLNRRASVNLVDEVFGRDIVQRLTSDPRALPHLDVDALVGWLAGGRSVADKVRLRRAVERVDFDAFVSVVDLVWSRKVIAARAHEWQSEKQELLAKLRALKSSLIAFAPQADGPLRQVISLVEETSPIVGAPIFAGGPVHMDVMLDPDTGARKRGRPGAERDEIEVLLRKAGVTAKDDLRLILTLLGDK